MKLRSFFLKANRRDLEDELSFHFEQLVQENVKHGMNRDEARRKARLAFGNLEQATEQTAGQYPGWWLDAVRQDVHYGFRGLRLNLSFAVAAVLTLALGIGPTAAVFSVVDRILFRSLPYADGDRLVSVGLIAPIMPQEFMLGSGYYVWKQHQIPFERFSSWTSSNLCDLLEANPAHLTCANVESDFLPTLGIALERGRNFSPDEDVPKAPRVALISHALWRSRFGEADDILEKTISLDGEPTRIVGVLPQTFEMPTLEHVDIVLPQRLDEAQQRRSQPGRVMFGIARLRPGVTVKQAIAQLQPLFQDSVNSAPPRFRNEVHLRVRPLRDFQVHDARLTAWVLLGAVLAVLFISGANVSGLLLARASERRAEFGIRQSLGASRFRLFCQMITEALVLSSLGVGAGCALAKTLLRIFVAMAPRDIPYIDRAQLDLRVLGLAVIVAFTSAVVFGSVPFWERGLLSQGVSALATAAPARARGRQLLLTVQLGVTLMLLASAGLLLRTVHNLRTQALGMHTDRVVVATMHFSRQRYAKDEKKVQLVDEVEGRLRQIPGVNSVAVSDTVPPGGLEHDQIYGAIYVEGRPKPEGGTGGRVAWRWVTPQYFSALGIPILRGSGFSEAERQSNDHLAILSEALANRMFPAEDPIGKRVAFGQPTWYTIVGVAANAKNQGLAEESEPEYYRLWRDRPEDWPGQWTANLILSTPAKPEAIESLIRSEVANFDSTVPVEFQTMHERMVSMAQRPRFEAALLSLFAGFAVLLAAIGVYGLIRFIVTRRTKEIAVRMALGAGKQDIVGLIARDGVQMVGLGLLFGISGALGISRLLGALLFGVNGNDLLTLTAAAAFLTFIAVAAICLPLRRALRLEPMGALRCE